MFHYVLYEQNYLSCYCFEIIRLKMAQPHIFKSNKGKNFSNKKLIYHCIII